MTRAAESEGFSWVSDFLPGGEGALAHVGDGGSEWEIRALRFDTGEMKTLTPGSFPRYAASGHLVYLALDGTLMAARFDPDEMELLGPPVALVEGVAAFTISQTGKLFYSRGAAGGQEEFVWVTRSGQATPVEAGWSFEAGVNPGWSLSPDGTRLALKSLTDGNDDIRVKELDDGPYSRLTFYEGVDMRPRWTPDGESVTFLSNRSGSWDLWSRRADGTGVDEVVFEGGTLLNVGQAFWGPEGEWLVLRTGGTAGIVGGRDIFALRPGVDSIALPLLAEEYDEQQPALSPDGLWLAYTSTEAGSTELTEVFVRPFPDVDSGRWQVSTAGGMMPLWAHSGRELFFVDGSRALVAAQVETDSGFQVGEKETLFTLPPGYLGNPVSTLYDIAPEAVPTVVEGS